MTQATRITAAVTAIGGVTKALRVAQGDLTALTTTEKTNLVGAINELAAALASQTGIDDTKGDGDLNFTWSANKIFDVIEAAKQAVKDELLDGASGALNTLKELGDALGGDPNLATTLAGEINNRVRFDAVQTLTLAQKLQARENIAAVALTDITDLTGDLDTDYEAAFVTANT